MGLRYAFFPGCVIPAKYPHFESATRLVAERLGIELVDLPFSCCPSSSNMKLVHYDSWLTLAARNLCIAEEQGLDIMTICTGCSSTLKEVNFIMKEKPHRARKANRHLKKIGRQYEGGIGVKHWLDVLYDDVGLEGIAEKKVYDLNMKIACHYGCHLFRPGYIMYPEFLSPSHSYVPTSMEEILEALGADPVGFMRRFLCCGYPLSANVAEEPSYSILREKLFYMKAGGAQLISVACASCFEQFELGQLSLKRNRKEDYGFPTLYISQLLGLAFGIDPKKLGLKEHIYKAKHLLPLLRECTPAMSASV